MTKKTKEETQLYLDAFLPDAVGHLLESYQDFLNEKSIDDLEKSKAFLEFHKACKAALSNMEQLLKLYKLTEYEGKKIPQEEDVEFLIQQSRERLKEVIKT